VRGQKRNTGSRQDDLARLRAEYADRERRLAGSDIYSLFNPAHLFMTQHVSVPYSRHCAGWDTILWTMHGIDLLQDRMAEAHARVPSLALSCADGQHLPYPDSVFDLVMQYTAFSSILDDTVKANVAREMLRVLRPRGAIVWYDYWLNPINPQARGIRPTEIRRLFPDCEYDFQRVTLAPPITRRLISVSWLLCYALEKMRVLNTHYLAVIRKCASSGAIQ